MVIGDHLLKYPHTRDTFTDKTMTPTLLVFLGRVHGEVTWLIAY